eukprot:scaffold19183_cov112-Isochrysis_galbana.AAC.2
MGARLPGAAGAVGSADGRTSAGGCGCGHHNAGGCGCGRWQRTDRSKLNRLMRIILKTLVTLMGTDGAQKMRGALMAFANWCDIESTCCCSSTGASSIRSNLQPTSSGMAHLFRSRAFWCHTRIESSVSGLDRSNSSSIAAASLHTSGSIDSKSLCPPMSQMEKVTSWPRRLTDFSMKLTPCGVPHRASGLGAGRGGARPGAGALATRGCAGGAPASAARCRRRCPLRSGSSARSCPPARGQS